METSIEKAYESQAAQCLDRARGVKIVDDKTRQVAAEFTSNLRKIVRIIEDEFKPDIAKAHELHKSLIGRKDRLIAPFKNAQVIVDKEISRDYLERERIRREEQAQIEREVRRLSEEERMREAASAIQEGALEDAEAILDAPESEAVIVPIAVPTQKTTVTSSGSATVKKDITVECVDVRAVLAAVLSRRLPESVVSINLGEAKRYAKLIGTLELPGFRITETAIVSGRSW